MYVCKNCHGILMRSPVKGYAYYCPDCNEDFYLFEAEWMDGAVRYYVGLMNEKYEVIADIAHVDSIRDVVKAGKDSGFFNRPTLDELAHMVDTLNQSGKYVTGCPDHRHWFFVVVME